MKTYAYDVLEDLPETSMNTKHTPGKWVSRKPDDIGGSRVYVDCKGGSLVATPGYTRDTNESEANARLIAATPELLTALECMIEQFGFHRVHNGMVNDEREAITAAMEVVKKATGG